VNVSGAVKSFFQGVSSGKISFYQLETKRKTFCTIAVTGKYQMSKSRGAKTSRWPHSGAHVYCL